MSAREARIIVFMTNKGPVQKGVLEGFYSQMKLYLPHVRVDELDAQGPNDDTIKSWLNELTIEDADLVITIGDRSTTLLIDNFEKRRFPLPVVFCALTQPVMDQVNEHIKNGAHYLSGVFVKPLDNVLPIQLLMRLIQHKRRVLLPYRRDAKGGRVSFEVNQIKKYLEDRSIEVVDIDLCKMKAAGQLRGAVKSADVVVVPEGGLTAIDVQQLADIADVEGVPLFSDGQDAQQRGGIYGFKNDFSYMGVKAADIVSEVLVNQKRPCDIEICEIESSRKLHNIDAESMAKCGVFIADDVVASLDEKVIKNRELPTAIIGMHYINETGYSHGLHMLTGQLLAQEDDIFYCIWDYNGWWENKDFMRKHIKYVSKKNVEAMVFCDDRMAHLVWKEVHRTGTKFPPMIIVSIEDEVVDEEWHNRAREEGYTIARIVLPKPDPIIQLDMLSESMKELKTLTLFLKCKPETAPLFIENRIEVLREECDKRGITLNVIGGFAYGELIDITNELTPASADAYMFFQDFFCGKVGAFLINRCEEMGVPICAGGISWSQIAPLCYGVDLVKLRQYLVAAINRIVRGEHKKEHDYLTFAHNDIYALAMYDRLCKKLKLSFSPLAQHMIDLVRRDVMYERNAAACLQAVGVDKDGKSLMIVPVKRKRDRAESEQEPRA